MAGDKDKKQEQVQGPGPSADNIEAAVAKAVETALEKAIPVAVMAAQKVAGTAQATGFRGAPARVVDFGPRCSECGQYETACKGEHVKMIVAPRNPRRFKSFPGIFINSIQYKSPNMYTPVTVPADNDFSHKIKMWEEGEEDLRSGRTVKHDSGTLSGRPDAVNKTHEYAGAGFRG